MAHLTEHLFLSTLSLRRATQVFQRIAKPFRISIHALLAESDVNEIPYQRKIDQFLSTLSLRRATQEIVQSYIYYYRISIHALLAESDPASSIIKTLSGDFYPRSPCGERRQKKVKNEHCQYISIHALLAESDIKNSPALLGNSQFLSTLSLRRATSANIFFKLEIIFLSTLSLRRATLRYWSRAKDTTISIHALLAESDLLQDSLLVQGHNFYPRSPCGERQVLFWQSIQKAVFLSTLSLRRATRLSIAFKSIICLFLSTLSLRRATE